MAYKAERVDGEMTVGEARVLAAMACGVSLESAESFAVVVFAHLDTNKHDLIVTSNLGDTVPLLFALLDASATCISQVESIGPVLADSSKAKHLITHIRASIWPWKWF